MSLNTQNDHPVQDSERKDRTKVVVNLEIWFKQMKTYFFVATGVTLSITSFLIWLSVQSSISPFASLLVLGLSTLCVFRILFQALRDKLIENVISRAVTRFMNEGEMYV